MAKNKNKIWFLIFKIGVFSGTWSFIGWRLFSDDSFYNIFIQFQKTNIDFFFISIAVGIMPLNWGIESIKWKILLKPLEHIKPIESFKSVLSGLSVATFTPNRTGEYAGRIWILDKKNRWPGVSTAIVGSIAQTGVTVFAGTIAGLLWLQNKSFDQITSMTHVVIGFAIVLLGFIGFVFLPELTKWLKKYKLNKTMMKVVEGFCIHSKQTLIATISFSVLRYILFSFQFYILLVAYGVNISAYNAILGTSLIYAGMLAVPTITLTEPGVRGALTLTILGFFSQNHAGILAASLTLWIINLAFPALIGSGILAKTKLTNHD